MQSNASLTSGNNSFVKTATDEIAVKIQELLPSDHPHKNNFATYHRFIRAESFTVIDAAIAQKPEQAILFLLMAAEMGNLSVCKHITTKHPGLISQQTPNTNLLFAIIRCNDESKRSKLFDWLYSNYESLTVWKPFKEEHILAASGLEDYDDEDESTNGEIVLYDQTEDNLGLTPLDYFIVSGQYFCGESRIKLELTETQILKYIRGPLQLCALGDYIGTLIEKVNSQEPTDTSENTSAKYKIDFNYRESANDPTLAWCIAYHTAIACEPDSDFIYYMATSGQTINLAITPNTLPSVKRQATYDHLSKAIENATIENEITKQKIARNNNISLLTALFLSQRFTSIGLLLLNDTNINFDINAVLVPTQPTLGTYADYLKSLGEKFDGYDFYLTLLVRDPGIFISLCEAVDYAANFTLFHAILVILAARKEFAMMRELVDRAQKSNPKRSYAPKPIVITSDLRSDCLLYSLLEFKVPEDIILKLINHLEFAELITDFNSNAAKTLSNKLRDFDPKQTQTILVALDKRFHKILNTQTKSAEDSALPASPPLNANSLNELKTLQMVQDSLPQYHKFKSDYRNSVIYVVQGKIQAINDEIKNGKHFAIEYVLLAAETGILTTINFLTFQHRQSLNVETPGTNVLFAVCNCPSDESRRQILQWLLNSYDELPYWKPFTKNHINAALGNMTDEIREDIRKDNLGFEAIDYYIASGHLLNTTGKNEKILLSTQQVSSYVHNQLKLQSLGTYLISTNQAASIDWSFKRTSTDQTLAWHVAYYTAIGHDPHGSLLTVIARSQQVLDLQEKGIVAAPSRSFHSAVIKDSCVAGTYNPAMLNKTILDNNCLDLLRIILLTKRFTTLGMILETNRNCQLDLAAPLTTNDKSQGTSCTIAQFILDSRGAASLLRKLFSLWPAKIISFCNACGFAENSETRSLLTIVLLSLGNHKDLIELLDNDKQHKIKFNLNSLVITPTNSTNPTKFANALLDMNASAEVLVRIISRIDGRFAHNNAAEPNFDERIRLHSDKSLYVFLKSVYDAFPPVPAPAPVPVPSSQSSATPKKSKPKQVSQLTHNTPPQPAVKPTLTTEQELDKNLQSYFNDAFKKVIDGEAITITVTGSSEAIKRISDATKRHEISACKVDRSQISKGILVFSGKIKAINEYFKNGSVSSTLITCKRNEKQTNEDNKNKNSAKTEKTENTKTVLDLDPTTNDITTKSLHDDFKKALHHAFCKANQVNIEWDKINKRFILSIDVEQTTWVIKGTQQKHSKRFQVLCTPSNLEEYIIRRVTNHLDELKQLTCKRQGNQLFVTIHAAEIPDFGELSANVENQFLKWEHRVITVERKITHNPTLFAKQPVTPVDNVVVNGTPDFHFRRLYAMISENTPDKIEHFLLKRVIEADLKYELTCHYKRETLLKLRAFALVINRHLNNPAGCIFIHDNNPNINIFIHTNANDLYALNDMAKLRAEYQTALHTEIEAAKLQKPAALTLENSPAAAISSIIPAAAKPQQKALSPEEEQKMQIEKDKETLKRAITTISEKQDTTIIENLNLHIQALSAIQTSNKDKPSLGLFYAYLYHATRLFVILAHLSFDANNPDNLFYQWRNVLRHAHLDENLNNLHDKISYITSLVQLQIELYCPNVKIVKNGTLTDEKFIQMRKLLSDSSTKKKPKHYLQKIQTKAQTIRDDKSAGAWQSEAEVMLESLSEKHSPDSKRLIYKQLGHNNVYDVEDTTEVLKRNLHIPHAKFLSHIHTQLPELDNDSTLRKRCN